MQCHSFDTEKYTQRGSLCPDTVLIFFISFSLFQSSYAAAKGHIVLKCRANIKGITATLVAIRANENFGEGRPAVWVWLRTS